MEWLSFAIGAAAMLAFLATWGILEDWALERRIRAREEALRRERKERQKRFEARQAVEKGVQGSLFDWGSEDETREKTQRKEV